MIQIKQVRPTLILKEKIAIVGSSTILLEQQGGRTIDSFDEVVRFNRSPTKGWEKYVGSKTTLRVANNHVFANVKHNVGGDENCEDWKAEGQPQYFIKELENQKVLLLNKDASAWEKRHLHAGKTCSTYLGDYDCVEFYGGCSSPSVGYAFITLCIMNGITPTLFGFGVSEQHNKASHYWENKDNIISSHGYNLERENIRTWHETGKLVIK